jgi:hypothetical protein
MERQSMSPATVAAVFRWLYATDVRAVLPCISAPTLVFQTVENRAVSIEHGRYLVPRQATFARFTSSRSARSWALRFRQPM